MNLCRRRHRRPRFDFNLEEFQAMHDQQQNWRLFDWWCDNDDHAALVVALDGAPLKFRTRAPREDDPAPPIGKPAPQGFRDAWMLSSAKDIDLALENPDLFSNIAYAPLGGGSFLLGQDPSLSDHRHREQVSFVKAALAPYVANRAGLARLADLAVEQAALTALASPDFDLAAFAEQAGLRYLGMLFGYGFQDHALLEDASRTAYRALQYIAVGQHFASEPGVLGAAQQAVGQLVARTSDLVDQYSRLTRAPRCFGTPNHRSWPTGVQPWAELELRALGEPLLKGLNGMDSPLSGRDRAMVCSMLLAGTLGNVQSAVCLIVQELSNSSGASPQRDVRGPAITQHEYAHRPDLSKSDAAGASEDTLEHELVRLFCGLRPVTVLPRRTLEDVNLSGGQTIPKDTDCLLLLEGSSAADSRIRSQTCPHAWGQASGGAGAIHPCLGKDLAWPLILAIVGRVKALPGLTQALDPLTGEVLGIERLWGFACTKYPMRYDRQRKHQQQNLIISMQVKSPIAQNAAALRKLLASSVPRIDAVLVGFEGVHFAWFEFSENDSRLVLRTVYDGQFEAYIRHFAIRAGDLFDGLFEFLDDAPTRPVAEHPDDFVETIRRFNHAPLAGYLYSAYPGVTVTRARQAGSGR